MGSAAAAEVVRHVARVGGGQVVAGVLAIPRQVRELQVQAEAVFPGDR